MTGRDRQTKFLVEATDFERFTLRQQHRAIAWVDMIPGEHRTVGYLTEDKTRHPICVSLMWISLNGHHICFWDAVSRVVDHHQIEMHFNRFFPGVRRINANNFHVALHSLGLPVPQ